MNASRVFALGHGADVQAADRDLAIARVWALLHTDDAGDRAGVQGREEEHLNGAAGAALGCTCWSGVRAQETHARTSLEQLQLTAYLVGPAKSICNRQAFMRLSDFFSPSSGRVVEQLIKRATKRRHEPTASLAGPLSVTAPIAAGAKKAGRCPDGQWRAVASAGCSLLHNR